MMQGECSDYCSRTKPTVVAPKQKCGQPGGRPPENSTRRLVDLFLHRGELQLRLCQRLNDKHFGGLRAQVARCRHLAHKEILGAFQHFLLAEGEGFAPAEGYEALKDYGYFEERTRAHALGVLLESMFPVVVRVEFSFFEKTQHLRRVVGTYYRSEANRERV